MTMKVSFNGVEYRWIGGFGVQIESRERVRVGTTRVIDNRLYYCFSSEGGFRPRAGWCLYAHPGNVTAEDLRCLKAKLFGTDSPWTPPPPPPPRDVDE